MQLYSTQGIIFRTLKYSETSIICDIYTKDKGLRSFIVSGVRNSKKGSNAAIFIPLNIVDLVAYDADIEKLARIKEINFAYHFSTLNLEVIPSSMAIFILEVCRNAIKEREANEELYNFIIDWIQYLDHNGSINPNLHLLFMYEFSAYLGLEPMKNYSNVMSYFDMLEGAFCTTDPGGEYILDMEDSNLFSYIMDQKREQISTFKTTKIQRDRLTDQWLLYYKLHLPGFKELLSLDVLRSVL
jgi:DNA repair protein RecO (recombination protein O)